MSLSTIIQKATAEHASSKHGPGKSGDVSFEQFNSAFTSAVADTPALAKEVTELTKAQQIMLFQSLHTESFKGDKDSSSFASGKDATQFGSINAPRGYADHVRATQESFANTNKANVYSEINANLNVGLAIQDKFGECFYPSTPIKQEEAGKVFEVAVPYRYDGVLASDFSPSVFFEKAVNLIDAMYTPDIVASSSTRLIPNKTPTKLGTNISASLFADSVNVYYAGAPGNVLSVKPILSDKEINLFDADNNPSSPAVEDALDSISPALIVEKLAFKGTLGLATPVVGTAFTIDTRNTAGSQLVKNAVGGNEYDYVLNLKGSTILSVGTLNLAGTSLFTAELLDADVFVEVEYSANGSVNLRNRTVKLHVDAPKVKRAYRVSALGVVSEIALSSSTAGANIQAIVTYFAAIDTGGTKGWWPNATRANSVARVAGILVDYKLSKWSTAVDFGSPISVLGSLLESSSSQDAGNNLENKVNTMRQAGYANICGQAVQRLLEHASILKDRYGSTGTAQVVRARDDFGLPSSHFTMPYYKEVTLDLTTTVNSIKSSEKMADIQAALLNYIRQEAYDMIRNSRIRAAYMILHPNKKINIKIGTDSVISRYLVQQGDVRTLGDDVDCEIVQTDNVSMKNKIILTVGLRSEDANAEDFLSFGKHFIAPESIFEINDSLASVYGGVKRTVYYPRNKHVSMLNVMCVINVDAAKFIEAVALATAYDTTP